MTKAQVLGMGAAAMDVVMRCDALPRTDGFAFVQDETLLAGGSCANVLATLAGMGTGTALVAQMGADAYGRAFLQDLEQTGIDPQFLKLRPGGISLHTVITVAQDGAKAIFAHMGDSLLTLTEDDVSAQMLDNIAVFYCDLMPAKPALKLARMCRQRGIRVVFNLQAAPDFMALCGVDREEIAEMLSLCDLFITFQDGLAGWTKQPDFQTGCRMVYDRFHPDMGVVVTLGREGSLWHGAQGEGFTPAFHVEARDTTGAGDAFAGGLIQALYIDGAEPAAAARFATACAALKCIRPGPRLGVDQKRVAAFLLENGYGESDTAPKGGTP